MVLPLLSAYTTLENSQGTIDPLGFYTIADRLALRLVPDMRERMSHPRYLTAMAVGAVVCSAFSDDELAVDEQSPPWQVYEWYVTSALVKKFDREDPDQLLGMPAREKATRAMREGVPLSATRYLKTASVFGFHGVYRTLARGINLLDGNHIGEFGTMLVDTWEKEQCLEGFRIGINGSPGNEFRIKLQEAVRAGLQLGAVAKTWSWDFYNRIAEGLAPKRPGQSEAKLLYEVLLNGVTPYRAELIRFLQSPDGKGAFAGGSERELHAELLKKDPECKELLAAIMAYERVCRIIYNAFYEILQWMEAHPGKNSIARLTALTHVGIACDELPDAFNHLDRALQPFLPEYNLYNVGFQNLRENYNPADWVKLLFEHHFKIQRNKPPNGKAPWILEYSRDEYLLNGSQAIDVELSDEYVHQYRTYSLLSFLKDLRRI